VKPFTLFFLVCCALLPQPAQAWNLLFVSGDEAEESSEAVASELSRRLQPGPGATAAPPTITRMRAGAYAEGGAGDLDPAFATAQRLRGRLDEAVASTPVVAPRVVVAFGPAALQAVVQADTDDTAVVLLTGHEQVEEIAGAWARRGGHRVLALTTDQPPERELLLAAAALPGAHRYGAIYAPDGEWQARRLREAAAARHLALATERVGDSTGVTAALERIAPHCDALLVLSDAVSTAPGMGQILLQWAFNARVPVIASTGSFVSSGALVGVYSTPEQVARQAAELIPAVGSASRPAGAGGQGVEIIEPRYFSVKINFTIARRLGLELPAEASLEAALGRIR
jgi:ABC-type uncharacterized transport system substrate-binding protein